MENLPILGTKWKASEASILDNGEVEIFDGIKRNKEDEFEESHQFKEDD